MPSASNGIPEGAIPKGLASHVESPFRRVRISIRGMESEGRGPLLYAYRPIPANPMTVAIFLLVLVVTLVIGPIVAAPEGLWPLGGFCFLPLAVVLLTVALFKPSATRVFEDGIEVSLRLSRRPAASRRYVACSATR